MHDEILCTTYNTQVHLQTMSHQLTTQNHQMCEIFTLQQQLHQEIFVFPQYHLMLLLLQTEKIQVLPQMSP